MADASFAQTSFLGGLWSKYAQGRWDRPDYRTAMNECLNLLPMEQGACTRRPGTQFASTTRNGQAGRIISFDFEQAAPYTVEFTAGFLRFRVGPTLVSTNDDQAVASITLDNPVKVNTGTHGWASGNSVMFANLGTTCPLLQNRIFIITVTSATQFTLVDAITGTAIDGATLGSISNAATVRRILEVASPYSGTLWQNLRLVQTELTAVLLHPAIPPYTLTAIAPPAGKTFFSFTLIKSNLLDGPYLDPPTNGALITPSAVNGNITLTISFNAYVATTSYSIGDFVTDVGVNYRSLTDQNEGNVPAGSPSNWAPVSAGLAIGPNGFQGSDIGRLIRIQDSANNWTWGKITAVANLISGTLAGSVNIGDMTGNGGLAAAFDGNTAQAAGACAFNNVGNLDPVTSYVGKNYTGASAQAIGQATFWPSSDQGAIHPVKSYMLNGVLTQVDTGATLVINLRAKASAPANSADGTLLGSATFTGSPLTIISNNTVTTWNYVWLEMVVSNVDKSVPPGASLISFFIAFQCSEAQFFNPTGTGSGSAVTFQVLGPALANTTARSVWRLGVYSNTTGWPSCGTYHEGRLWLAGSLPNRIDSSVSNQEFNFAPTSTTGTVLDSSAISAVFNGPDVNPVFWMTTDALGIIVGTQAGDWLVQASNNNNVLTPTSFQAHRYSRLGCANIEPRRMDRVLVIVQRYRRKLYEYFADVYSGKFSAKNLTWAMRSLTSPGIAEIAVQQELAPIVWARCDDGSLFGITYKRESITTSQPPEFAAGHRHLLGNGHLIESVAGGPSIDGNLDSLTMVTNDPSENVRHVEILTTIFEEGTSETEAWFLDDAVTPSSITNHAATASGTDLTDGAGVALTDGSGVALTSSLPPDGLVINGLWHLNNETVTVFAGGIDCGDFPVVNGSVTALFGGIFNLGLATAGPIVVGHTFTSRGQLVRPATPQESGARNGPALGKKRRSMQIAALLDNTAGISFGTDFAQMLPANFKQDNGTPFIAGQMFSGVYWDMLKDNYSFDGMACWEVTRPYSATVVAIEQFIHTQDK
jgi:hypothetical protein